MNADDRRHPDAADIRGGPGRGSRRGVRVPRGIRVLKYPLVALGSLMTLVALTLIALAAVYSSLGINKPLLEKYLSEQLERPVQIESLQSGWEGALAVLDARGVRIRRNDETQSSVRLGEIEVAIHPLYLLAGEWRVERLVVHGLTMALVRQLDGRITVGDFEAANAPGVGLKALDWLMQQPSTSIRDSKVVWRDQQEPDYPVLLDAVEISLERGPAGVRFSGRASPPERLGDRVQIEGVVRSAPFRGEPLTADVAFNLSGWRLDRMPIVLKRMSPWQTAGVVDARAQAEWRAGRMIHAEADVALSGITIPFEGGSKEVPVDHFSGRVSWQREPDRWRLSFEDPRFVIHGRRLDASHVELDWSKDTRRYSAENVSIDEITEVFEQFDFDFNWHRALRRIQPRGRFANVSVEARGKFLSPSYWRFEGRFEDVAWEPFGRYPGVAGAWGRAEIEPAGGRVDIESSGLELDWPGVLAEPLALHDVGTRLAWSRAHDEWRVRVDDLAADGSDIRTVRGRLDLRIPADRDRRPYVDGEFTVAAVPVARLERYLPVRIMSDKTVQWFNKALAGGTFTDTRVSFTGDLARFPFRDGGGAFALATRVVDGELRYADGWPGIKEIQGELRLDNAALSAQIRSATIMNSRVEYASVQSADVYTHDNELSVYVRTAAPAQDIVQFLTVGPLVKQPQDGVLDIKAEGGGELEMTLRLPLHDLKQSAVAGRYQARDSTVTVADRFVFRGLNGVIDFTQSTVHADGVEGSLLGGNVSIAIETVKAQQPPVWVARARGEADAKVLLPLIADGAEDLDVAGSTRWSGALRVGPGATTLDLESDLKGVRIGLPAPLSKAAGEKRKGRVRAVYRRDSNDYSFELDAVAGRLEFHRQGADLALRRGVITVGQAQPGSAPEDGIALEISTHSLDADAWLSSLARKENSASPASLPLRSLLRRIDLKVDALRLFSRDLGTVYARANSSNGSDWNAWLSGDAVSGHVEAALDTGGPDRYVLLLDRLDWPKSNARSTGEGRRQPYPDLMLKADHFTYGDWDLGKMELSATSYVGRWSINRLDFEQPGLVIRSHGHWVYGQGGSTTEIRSTLTTDDAAVALRQLGLPPHIVESKARLDLVLSWSGSPDSFELTRLEGRYDLAAEKGRFLNVEPGSGRLLGLFNIDAISRRLSLDFSDITSKGLTFDRIKGSGRISDGNLFSDGLFVAGPSSLIEIHGRTGLSTEDYDLEVIVVPQLSSQISMLSALANPLAGAMVFFIQKVFRKQLAKMVHYKYEITGTWDAPIITSLHVEPKLGVEGER